MTVDYYYDDYDGEKIYYVKKREFYVGDWVEYEEVTKLENLCKELNKRLAELEIENMILKQEVTNFYIKEASKGI